MPFEKKKKYKTAGDYKQKSIYLDENDPYQAECLHLLTLCGHKQSKFLGLLVHDLIQRNGINIENLDKDNFKDFMRFFELQMQTGMNNPFGANGSLMQVVTAKAPVQMSVPAAEKKAPKILPVSEETLAGEDDFISEEDMDDMNAALAAFGV